MDKKIHPEGWIRYEFEKKISVVGYDTSTVVASAICL